MVYFKREMEKIVNGLLKEYACILITGARQVGKSTMLGNICKGYNFVSLDDIQERILAKNDPELFLKLHSKPVVIDEVQYAPELFSYIKIDIDKGAKAGTYILTGSQSFDLMRLSQESLAGRIAILSLPCLSSSELNGNLDFGCFLPTTDKLKERFRSQKPLTIDEIYNRIWKGGMPALLSEKYTNRDIYYSSYFQTFIARDIKEQIGLRDDYKFVDFIRSLACRVAEEVNIHSIANDVGISDDSVKRWLKLLEKSQIIFFLYPYSNNLLKRTIKNPKLYFYDCGIVAYLTKHLSSEILMNSAINGAIFENYVVSEIKKSYQNSAQAEGLYYYRDRDKKEIDLIIEYNRTLYPIEIKKSANPTMDMVKNFNVLKSSDLSLSPGCIICMKDNLSALPSGCFIFPAWCV